MQVATVLQETMKDTLIDLHNYSAMAMMLIEEHEKREQEEEEQQQDQNQEQEPPTEYAKAIKARAEELVSQKKYQEAFDLMIQASQVDQTVQNFNQFINRIGAVSDIDS